MTKFLTFRLDEIAGSYATIGLCAELGVPNPTVSVDLPALRGSEKQIEWACGLRRRAALALVARAVGSPAKARETLSRLVEFRAQLQAWLNRQTTARAWIDAR